MEMIRECSTCFNGDPIPNIKCCFNCGRDASICEVCHSCGSDCREWVPMTNADRIRAMSDQELAKLLNDNQTNAFCHSGLCLDGETCVGCALQWLKQPAENFVKDKLNKNDLEAIGALAHQDVQENDVYTFSIQLCNNEIDRDFERFSAQTIEELSVLFVGKSGIIDHNWTGRGRSVRIYKTEVVYEPGRKTSAGDAYCWLKGYAYILRTGTNNALIDEIEAKGKKDVSIGCSVNHFICSICGTDRTVSDCGHKRGQLYNGKLCYSILEGAFDAYEFAFVVEPKEANA